MPRAAAIVLTLSHSERSVSLPAEGIAKAGIPVVAAGYARADLAALRTVCEPLGIRVADECFATWAEAANAGAAATSGDTLVFVDGALPITPQWLEPLLAGLDAADGGLAGPHIVTNRGTANECGAQILPAPLSMRGFSMRRLADVPVRTRVDAVPRDCFAVGRATFDELGGFDALFGDDHDALDFCLRAGEARKIVLFEPGIVFARSSARAQRDETLPYREDAFAQRWRARVEPRENFRPEDNGGTLIRRWVYRDGIGAERLPVSKTTLIVHGDAPAPVHFIERLRASRMQPASIVWAAPGAAPADARVVTDAQAAIRELTEPRGWEYLAFVRTDTVLCDDWLNELINVLERAPETLAATVTDAPEPEIGTSPTADARCTLVAPSLMPQHVRVAPATSVDAALAAWLAWGVAAGRNVAHVRGTTTTIGPPAPLGEPQLPQPVTEPFASIIMLSWNAIEFTEGAIASIKAHTPLPHEIIIIDNGSEPETVERLRTIEGITVIYNAVNTGFAFACNQGLAAGRGTHLVLLNNDVIVTDGWLEALLAVQARNPAVGCSAPRTNRISAFQQIDNVPYTGLDDMVTFAAQRAREFAGRWTNELRVVGFCMCLDRRLVDELGGLDPTFEAGNFEDDDYCIRMKAAGYDLAVCEDSFIHHFGSVTFRANKIDYNASIERNKKVFAARWDATFQGHTYDPHSFHRAYDRARDFVPLPAPAGVGPDWVRPA